MSSGLPFGSSINDLSDGKWGKKEVGGGKKQSFILMYQRFFFKHVLLYERFLRICIIVSAVLININDYLSDFLENVLKSQWFSFEYIFQKFDSISGNIKRRRMEPLNLNSSIRKDTRLNYVTSIPLENVSYIRSETLFLKFEASKSGFLSLLGGVSMFFSAAFLIWLDDWPKHRQRVI